MMHKIIDRYIFIGSADIFMIHQDGSLHLQQPVSTITSTDALSVVRQKVRETLSAIIIHHVYQEQPVSNRRYINVPCATAQ